MALFQIVIFSPKEMETFLCLPFWTFQQPSIQQIILYYSTNFFVISDELCRESMHAHTRMVFILLYKPCHMAPHLVPL